MSIRIINKDTPDVPSENFDNYIDDQISYYKQMKHRDEELWEDFRLDFAKWQKDDFKQIWQRKRGILRSFLREIGIYTTKSEKIGDALTKLLDAAEPVEWPRDDLTRIIATGDLNRWRNPNLPGSYAFLRKEEEEPSSPGNVCGSRRDAQDLPESNQLFNSTQKENLAPGLSRASYGIQILHKTYQKEDKYSGAEDVLDKKLRIFYD